jgi:hypothetical protein
MVYFLLKRIAIDLCHWPKILAFYPAFYPLMKLLYSTIVTILAFPYLISFKSPPFAFIVSLWNMLQGHLAILIRQLRDYCNSLNGIVEGRPSYLRRPTPMFCVKSNVMGLVGVTLDYDGVAQCPQWIDDGLTLLEVAEFAYRPASSLSSRNLPSAHGLRFLYLQLSNVTYMYPSWAIFLISFVTDYSLQYSLRQSIWILVLLC